MARSSVKSDLLFGLRTLQDGLVDAAQLVDAIRAWTADESRTLADHIAAMGHLGGSLGPDAGLGATLPDAIAVDRLPEGRPDGTAAPTLGATHDEMPALNLDQTLTHGDSGEPGDDARKRGDDFTLGTSAAPGVSRFRVLRQHASGGLGAVFVAMDEELHREVALKQILARHADDPISRSRFLLEAEVTGGLEHPGIVPVYSLGAYADGRPYYAMRFIRGDSLKDAADRFHQDASAKSDPSRRSLGLRQLLRQFVDVCHAIEYAHSRGVLHRDIKPGNVIVGRHGETLVVDWGLAKVTGLSDPGVNGEEPILAPSLSGGSAETLPGRSLGTPAFMSPEQAEGALDRLGPRSDVYSLGATLFYLLTGRPPFLGDLGAMLGAVKRGDFRPPRHFDPEIDRALEAVCLKAMAHRPEDRYATASAMADDVERWMADEPVSAWREPLLRQARRWARRNRTAVTAAAVALIAGVVGLSAVLFVQSRANAALNAANDELKRSRAAVQARYDLAVEAIRTFHTGVSEDFLLGEERFRDLRDRLLRSAADFYGKLGKLLGQESDLSSRRGLAAANFELASLTAKVGRNADALAAHRSVLAARQALASDPSAGDDARVDMGRSLTEIAGLLDEAGQAAEALKTYREAQRVLAGPAARSTEARALMASCRSRMGGFLVTIGKNDDALAVYRLARADQEALAGAPGAPAELQHELSDTINRIGRLLANTGHPREAEAEYRQALAIRQALVHEHPDVTEYRNDLSASHNNLGLVLAATGRTAEAEVEERRAMALRQELVDRNPAVSLFREHLAASHYNLGLLLRDTGRATDAEAEQRQALAIYQELVERNPGVLRYRSILANTHVNLGRLLSTLGRPREGEAEYRQAVAIQRELVELNPAITAYRSSLATTYSNLGVLLAEAGQPAEAEFRGVVEICRELVARNPSVTEFRDRLALGHVNLGDLLTELGRISEAEPEYRAAADLLRELSDHNPSVTLYRHYLAYTRDHLGALLAVEGRASEAESEARAAVALYQSLSEKNPKVPDYADGAASALNTLGDATRAGGRPAEARDAYDRAVAIRERLVEQNPKVPAFRGGLAASIRRRGLARAAQGDPSGAAGDARRALSLYQGLAARSRQDWFETACCLAALAGLAGQAGSGIRTDQGTEETEAALSVLHRAVGMGFRNAEVFRTETALEPLRARDDFRLILMDVVMPDRPFAAAP